MFAAAGDGRKTPWKYQDADGNWHTTVGQHPQPFLKPALDKNRKQILTILANAVKEGMKDND